MVGTILKSVVALIGCLIVGDIAVVLFLVFIDILPFELFSTPLTYVTWFVCGIFTGLLAYNYAGAWSTPKGSGDDWSSHPQAGRIGWVIVATQAVTLIALSFLFYRLYWSQGVAGDYYVPDSEPHSLTYFITTLGAVIAARMMLMPTPGKAKSA